ncbi:RNA polymerase sigma factor SigJ [Nitriliruptor alkaliphilus]|uniref:RNA polymerase sigma factor SigJ n=1 Tax=Nitriliruptor alkaliphilus TaxID=427918 RepID=UPI000A7F1AD1|nr:RNA polymerase sigma factor SigJ [Nitriliruptor alkaliphilus]
MQEPIADVFERRRRYLLGVAYRLLGTVSEAEDAVQETWLRVHRTAMDEVDDVEAWLTIVTTRICYDVLKSARARRERYVGEWLPEPIVDGAGPMDPADHVTLDDSVNMALLVVLESLSPAERTAFVLHDVFKLPFDQIAEVVGRTPAACRQLAARARAHVEARAPRFDADETQHRRAVEAFTHAAETGDLAELLAVLDPEVVLRSDGGGKVTARRTPLEGAEAVARFVLAMAAKRVHMRQHVRTVNGQPGLVTTEDGRTVAVMGFAEAGGRITEIDLVMNPDKLPRDLDPIT